MSKRNVTMCDGCGTVIDSIKHAYHLAMTTDRFWNGVEMDYLQIDFDFCDACASDIKSALLRIGGAKPA